MSAITGSTALLADGFHKADDVAALVLSIYTERQTKNNPGMRRMLGFKQLNKLTGFAKGCIFLLSSVIVAFKIIQSMIDPKAVDGQTVLIVGSIAFIINFCSALMLRGSQKRYDVKTAYNALVYDALGSLIVVMGGGLDMIFGLPYFFDIIASVVLALYMARTGWVLIYKGRKLFLRQTPPSFDHSAFEKKALDIPGVIAIQDLHFWRLTETEYHLTFRVALRVHEIRQSALILTKLESITRLDFDIQHSTIQPVYMFDVLDNHAALYSTHGTSGSAMQFSTGGSPRQGQV